MSEKFETVKKYWDLGLWTEEKVRNAVTKGWITASEFFNITGKNY
ncbi:MAG: XkdX family protein [Synergistaceae bacterium]|nr:XkdX family protein [Synergistaceae bacterium]